MEKFAVIGLGPVGSILSAHLLKGGLRVILIEILREKVEGIKKEGLTVQDPMKHIIGNFKVFPQEVVSSLKALTEKPDFIFICVKTYNLKNVISEILDVFPRPPNLIIFQNGLDNEDEVAKVVGKEKVLRCVINYAGRMVKDTTVEITFFNRPNYIGSLSKKGNFLAKEIAEIISKTGIETEFTENIKRYEWEKALLNSALAPISALTGLTMKEIMDSSQLREAVEEILREGIKVGNSLGIEFDRKFFSNCISYLEKGGYHKPSMLIDIEAGRETEIEFLNGKISEYGKRLDIPVPYNTMISILVKGLEEKNKRRKDYEKN